jgi:hypothetical protein
MWSVVGPIGSNRFPPYGVQIWSVWPNIRFLPSIVTEKNATKNILDGRKDGRKDGRTVIKREALLDPSDSYFLFADFVDFYTHLTYICIWTFFVAFFKATIDDRNLIFGHKLPLRQAGSRNLTNQKTLPTIWRTNMKFVTKYQISAINSCWEKCD